MEEEKQEYETTLEAGFGLLARGTPYAQAQPTSITIKRLLPKGTEPESLTILFRRTNLALDHSVPAELPNMGFFPLYNVNDILMKRPQAMPAELSQFGGWILPMLPTEAMAIVFRATAPFKIKIYEGRMNAISGLRDQPIQAELMLGRGKLGENGPGDQDYVVVPGQDRLEGFKNVPPENTSMQFRAKRAAPSVFMNLLYLEITPAISPTMKSPMDCVLLSHGAKIDWDKFHVIVAMETEETRLVLYGEPENTVGDVLRGIYKELGAPDGRFPSSLSRDHKKLQVLQDHLTLSWYQVNKGCILWLSKSNLNGDEAHSETKSEIDYSNGSFIQKIWPDAGTHRWSRDVAICIPIRIVDPGSFHRFTGLDIAKPGNIVPFVGNQIQPTQSHTSGGWASSAYVHPVPPRIQVTAFFNGPLETSLSKACEKGDIEKVKWILAQGSEELDVQVSQGQTPLQLAVRYGHIEVVKLLIDHNCDLNLRTDTGDTPLICAVYRQNIPLVQVLLHAGASPVQSNWSGAGPMSWVEGQHSEALIAILLGEIEARWWIWRRV